MAAKDARTCTRESGSFMLYRGDAVAKRLATIGKLDKVGAKAELQCLKESWRELPEEDKVKYTDQSKASLVECKEQTEALPATSPDQGLADCFFGLGSKATPFTEESFEVEVRRLLRLKKEQPLPGHRKLCEMLRPQWADDALIESDSIPASLKVTCPLPCWKAHPGLCRSEDSWCWREASSLSALLTEHVLQHLSSGIFCRIDAAYCDDAVPNLQTYFVLGYLRRGKPRMFVAAECKFESNVLKIAEDPLARTIVLAYAGTLAKKVFSHPGTHMLPMLASVNFVQLGVENISLSAVKLVAELNVKVLYDCSAAEVADIVDAPAVPAGLDPNQTAAFAHWQSIMQQGIDDLHGRRQPAHFTSLEDVCKTLLPKAEIDVDEGSDFGGEASSGADSVDDICIKKRDAKHLLALFGDLNNKALNKLSKVKAIGFDKEESKGLDVAAAKVAPEPAAAVGAGEEALPSDAIREAGEDFPRLFPEDKEDPNRRRWLKVSPSASNEYSDIRGSCHRCGKTRTSNCKPKPDGETFKAKCAGRVIGHVSSFMLYDCLGDGEAHKAYKPDYLARRAGRQWFCALFSSHRFYTLFTEAERHVVDGLDDDCGEPYELPAR
jgi:hypothetical protein